MQPSRSLPSTGSTGVAPTPHASPPSSRATAASCQSQALVVVLTAPEPPACAFVPGSSWRSQRDPSASSLLPSVRATELA
ncbi:hypothetical protein FA09DRAFT_132007 [Tilletiopsis washingtonensis]|uniref:Uncharacterized protein n=1 Tax=Tilletiopsis washingtonensis TaxID=58919 RepID=A0A316Z2E7_9BASI|nr:hypothetical protein FA09DRAFT_132007 [Tilletiopsis washingtonensis]PWN95546.1 hypothetical protein FA09DRAFT_132007 [Tilletiopsis washingtonensis]